MTLAIRSLIAATLVVAFISAAQADDQMPFAKSIEIFPTLSMVCGAAPEAPKNTRPTDPRRPVARKVKNYLKATTDWIACADDAHDKIQEQLNTIESSSDKNALADFLSADFETHFQSLNDQIALFTNRLNRQNRWFRISGEIRETQKSSLGCGANVLNVRLCNLKNSMKALHGQRPFETDRLQPVKANTVTAPVFLSDGR